MSDQRPDVFSYLDPISFLRDSIEFLKKQRKFSSRMFARRAGFGSPSYLKMILDEKRRISVKASQKIAKALGLKTQESKFFELLVSYNRSSDSKEKEDLYRGLIRFKKFVKIQKADVDYFLYYSHWWNIVIREALSTHWEQKNLNEIQELLQLSEKDLSESLQLLSDIGLIEKSKENFKIKEISIQTPKQMQNLSVRSFHQAMLDKSKLALEKLPVEERDISAVTIALTKEQFEEIRNRISQFRREINSGYSGEKNAEQVYQINFQIFPLIKKEIHE